MSRYIKVSKYVPERVALPIQGYHMQVVVTEAGDMPKEIFVYQRSTSNGETFDQFCNIATPADLEEYPTISPLDGGIYYRLSAIDVIFRNISLADASWERICQDIQALVRALDMLDVLDSGVPVVFGESSSSEGSSESEG